MGHLVKKTIGHYHWQWPSRAYSCITSKKKSNRIDYIVYKIRENPSTIDGAINISPNSIRLLNKLRLYNKLNVRASSPSLLTLKSIPRSPTIQYKVREDYKQTTRFGV
jgi:hypothetical protein